MYFILSLFFLKLSSHFPEFSQFLHNACLQLSPSSEYQELYQGIVCAKNLSSVDLRQTFAATGLLHLLVVSGSHLLLVYSLLKKMNLPTAITLLLGFLYCLICQAEAPIIRAYVFIALSIYNQKHILSWSPWHRHLVAILICLLLHPQWIESLSFHLSILCAFALSLNPHFQNITVYLVLLPALILLGNYHPFTVLINLILGPALGLLLFPLSALSFFVPYMSFVTDQLWRILLWILSLLSPKLQTPYMTSQIYSPVIFWIYIATLWFLGRNFYYEKHRNQSHLT